MRAVGCRSLLMSLRSFAGLVGEVRSESFPVSYWRHLEFNLRRCERLWRDRQDRGGGSACSDSAQAGPSRAAAGNTDERDDDDPWH